MKLKRFVASVTALLMSVSSIQFTQTFAAETTDTKTEISKITYNFDISGVSDKTTLTFKAQKINANNEEVSNTLEVSENKSYSLDIVFDTPAEGLTNIGYFDVIDGSAIKAKLTSIKVNDAYELPFSKTVKIGKQYQNGFSNIWGEAAGKTISTGENAYLKVNDEKSSIDFFVKASEQTPTPEPEPETPQYTDDWTKYDEKDILTAKGNILISNSSDHVTDQYSGYIQSNQDGDLPSGDLFKIEYKVSGTVTNDTEIFNIQPFDSEWDGWADNIVTIGNSEYDESTGIYTAYLDINKVKASLKTQKLVKGINIAFVQAEPVVTLVSYKQLTKKSVTLMRITEEDLKAEGLTENDWKDASNALVYIKITKGNANSMINAMIKMGPDDATGTPIGKASSKYLVGTKVTEKSGNIIQDNLIGNAGTGIYVFPAINLNKSLQDGSAWNNDYMKEFTLTIEARTADTEFSFVGISFSNKKVYPAGFTTPKLKAQQRTKSLLMNRR